MFRRCLPFRTKNVVYRALSINRFFNTTYCHLKKERNFIHKHLAPVSNCETSVIVDRLSGLSAEHAKNCLDKVLQEYRTVLALLRSSVLTEKAKFLLRDGIYYASGNKNSPRKPYPPPNSKKTGKESAGDDKQPDQEDDENKITSLLAKAFLWMLTAYMLIAIISLLFPNTNQPE
ncbi:hypothetical protein J437_LFUL013400, partial [Ladona fulva]